MHEWSEFNIEVPYRITGHVYLTCPVCSEHRKKQNNKTLGVSVEHKSWGCNHCGFAGSLYKGITTPGEINKYAKGTMRSIKKEYLRPEYKEPESKYPPAFLELFKKRGISENTLKRDKVTCCRIKFSSADDPETPINAIAFPFYKEKVVVNIKFRGAKEKVFKQSYQAEKTVYGYDDIKGQETIIFTEGEMDKLSFNEVGILFAASVPDGAPAPNTKDYTTKFDFLETIEDIINNAKKVILATDADEAGLKLREELARRVGKEKCWIVEYPLECKDPNEVLVKYGPTELKNTIAKAKPYPISGIFLVQDIEKEIDDKFEQGITRGDALPWQSMQEIYRVAKGEFTTITGVPQSGKSEFIDCIAMHLCRHSGARFGIFSPEHPMWVHVFRLAEKLVNKPIFIRKDNGKKITEQETALGRPGFMSKDEFYEAKKFINEHFFWMKKERGKKLTLKDLHEMKRVLVLRYGVTHFIDDPYNKMDHARPKDMSEHEYISEFLDEYAEFNEDHHTHSFLAAHPTKLKKEKFKETIEVPGKDGIPVKKMVEVEKYPVATPYDISGSSHWWNKSYNVLSIYRDGMRLGTEAGKNKPTLIYVQKVKFKWNGSLDVGKLYFNSKTGNFHDSIESNGLQQPQNGSVGDSDDVVPF